MTLDKSRVAVLPLRNLSPDPNDEYFADGMTEELITSLSGVRQLTVIARTSVMKYKGSEKSASDVGKELNVGSLIEGSVRKAGNKVRITVQLIDTSTEGHLWAQNYDRQLEDVFAIQSEIAEKVAEELKIQLVDSEKRVITKKATENTEAYTYFLQGRELFRKGDEASIREAIHLFEKAIEFDPNFARGHSGLAACYQRLGNVGYEPYHEAITKAKAPLKRALELDPDLADAHAALSLMLFNEDDIVGAEAEARRAIELNPSLPEGYDALSNVVALKGEGEEAVKLVETYYRLDPIRPSYATDLGMAYFYTGREKEALEHWKKTTQIAPAGTYRIMAEYYLSKNDYEKAKELHLAAENLDPTNPWVTWMRGYIAAKTGNRDAALLAIRKIEEAKMGATGLNHIAYIRYALGDTASFFDYMNRALEVQALNSVMLMYSPLFAKVRTDPRYEALFDKMKKMYWPEHK